MIDETSINILKILQQKARVPNVEVARRINMAPSAVLERIRKLEKQEIINGYEVILNPERFNRSLVAFIHVYLTDDTLAEKTGNNLAAISEIQEVHFITGKDCFLVKARVSDTKQLETLLTEKISAAGNIKNTETSIALSTVKETSQIPLDSLSVEELAGI